MPTIKKFSAAVTSEAKKSESKVASQPQAYIFIGRDKYRDNERDPQEWRKLFLCLARMARNEDGSEMNQNTFGLSIVYDALTEMEKTAKAALKGDYEKAIEHHWAAVLKDEAERAARKVAADKATEEATKEVAAKRK